MTARDWSNISVSIGEAKNGTPFHIKRIYLEDYEEVPTYHEDSTFPCSTSIQSRQATIPSRPGVIEDFFHFVTGQSALCSALPSASMEDTHK